MFSKPQYTDLTYMGCTGLCGPMRIIAGSVIQSWYTSLNAKFGANRTFYVPNEANSFLMLMVKQVHGGGSSFSWEQNRE